MISKMLRSSLALLCAMAMFAVSAADFARPSIADGEFVAPPVEGHVHASTLVPQKQVKAPSQPYAYEQMFKSPDDDFRLMPYNNPKARPYLKGGLCCWPTPIDMTGDGRLDIVLQSWCVTPYAGTFVTGELGR